MELERTISEKGQIVIPKDVRKHLGLKPGSEIVFEIEDNRAIIKKKMNPRETVEDFLNVPHRKLKRMSISGLEELLDEEYEIP